MHCQPCNPPPAGHEQHLELPTLPTFTPYWNFSPQMQIWDIYVNKSEEKNILKTFLGGAGGVPHMDFTPGTLSAWH